MTINIYNKTETIITQYVEVNNFTFTIDNLNRVRSIGYTGSFDYESATPAERQVHRELAEQTAKYIRANLGSIRLELDSHLIESNRTSEESNHHSFDDGVPSDAEAEMLCRNPLITEDDIVFHRYESSAN